MFSPPQMIKLKKAPYHTKTLQDEIKWAERKCRIRYNNRIRKVSVDLDVSAQKAPTKEKCRLAIMLKMGNDGAKWRKYTNAVQDGWVGGTDRKRLWLVIRAPRMKGINRKRAGMENETGWLVSMVTADEVQAWVEEQILPAWYGSLSHFANTHRFTDTINAEGWGWGVWHVWSV